jgi:hypothetical protein
MSTDARDIRARISICVTCARGVVGQFCTSLVQNLGQPPLPASGEAP